jgi:hypothetical protein
MNATVHARFDDATVEGVPGSVGHGASEDLVKGVDGRLSKVQPVPAWGRPVKLNCRDTGPSGSALASVSWSSICSLNAAD